jgi:hypothetical protein
MLAAGVGYAVYASKKGDALVAEADAKQQKSYNEYRLGMEQINLEREKNKLSPRPILPIDEWLKWQAMPEKERAEVIEKRPPKPEEYQTPTPSPAPSVAPAPGGSTKNTKAEAELQKSYTDYRLGMERINMERECKGLKPQPILAIEEWKRQQGGPEKVKAEQQPKPQP